MIVTPLLSAFFASALLTWWLASGASPLAMLDHPNARSLHTRAVSRSGGIAILISVALGWAILMIWHGMPKGMIWIVLSTAIVAVISLLDDIVGLSPRARLPVHVLAAFLLIAGGFGPGWGWVGDMLGVVGIVWMLNLFNFMDGMDGFAGGMTLAGFGFLGGAGWMMGAGSYALYCWTVSAGVLGFLWFNFPPARIFMGDAGSATLGLMAAALSLWGVRLQLFPAWFPLLVFSPFIVDATVTLLRRGLRGERVWEAHRRHYYQRLVRAGWGHRKTVLAEYVLMAMAGGSGMWALAHTAWVPMLLAVWLVAYVSMMFLAERRCGPMEGSW